MDDQCQIAWIQRNRIRTDRTRQAGNAVAPLVANLLADGRSINQSLADKIAEVVDVEFQERCRLEAVLGNTLVISVDDASLVYPLRLRWSVRLTRLLAAAQRHPRIRSIRFELRRNL